MRWGEKHCCGYPIMLGMIISTQKRNTLLSHDARFVCGLVDTNVSLSKTFKGVCLCVMVVVAVVVVVAMRGLGSFSHLMAVKECGVM